MNTKALLNLLYLCSFFCGKAQAQFGTVPQIITTSDLPHVVDNVKKLAAHDLDGDGLIDIVATSAVGATFFRSDGFSGFYGPQPLIDTDFTHFPVGFFGAQFSDLDSDGLPDLAAGTFWRKNLGNGQLEQQQPVFEQNIALILDVDGDFLPDALSVDSTAIFWQKNLGAGNFAGTQLLSYAANPLIFNSVDFDEDGKPDFIARQTDGCFWYKNLGSGNFQAVQLLLDPPENLVTADLDNDGNIELIFNVGQNIEWQEFDETGQATPLQTISTKFKTGRGFALGDLDIDGDADLMVGGLTTGQSGSYFKFDSNTALFTVSLTTPTPGQFPDYGLLEIGDFNGDGKNDFCTASANNFKMVWLTQITNGEFSMWQFLQAGLGIPKSILSLDYNADGANDLVASGTLLVNLGNGQYDEKRWYPGGGAQGFDGDLDGDGLKDRALTSGNDSIYWQKYLGNNLWGPRNALPGLVTSCKQIAGGDLDNDGDMDLFACNGTDAVSVNARFYWFENDGTGHFEAHLLETDIQFCSNAFSLDVNEDGWLDMVLYFFNSYPPRVYKNLGNGEFAPPSGLFPAGTPSPSNVNQSMLTDLDADGRPDYVYITKAWGDQKIAWYRNLGSAGFSGEKILAAWSTNASWATNYFTVFDATGDGLPDLVISDNYWGKLRFIRGLGNATFSAMSIVYDETQPHNYGNFFAVAPHDVDGDGKLDIVWGKRNLMQNLPNYLMWLANKSPVLQPEILILNQAVACEDNGTPEDASDDIRVLKMRINNPTQPDGQFFLTDPFQTTPLDTFFYNQWSFFKWPPGSAGDGIDRMKEIHDLQNPAVFKNILANAIPSCSFDSPPTIAFFTENFWCDFSSTIDDPTDDFVRFQLSAQLSNGPQASTGFFITSNLGEVQADDLLPPNQGKYGVPMDFWIPQGSAGAVPEVAITLKDMVDTSIVEHWIFDNPCATVSAVNVSKNVIFSIAPNPVFENSPLRIFLENDFVGMLKFELLDVKGRVLETLEAEKTARQQFFDIKDLPATSQFFLRVSDGEASAVKLVIKLGE